MNSQDDTLPLSSSRLGLFYDLLVHASGEEAAARMLTQLQIEICLCVVDANHLLSGLKYRVEHGRPTALLQAAREGSFRLGASTTVRDEVLEHLSEVLGKYGLDTDAAIQIWRNEYLSVLTFIDLSEVPILGASVAALATRDPDDVPTGQLIELLQPDVAFSRDKDLAAL